MCLGFQALRGGRVLEMGGGDDFMTLSIQSHRAVVETVDFILMVHLLMGFVRTL